MHRRLASKLLVPVGARTFRLASTPRSGQGDVVAACLEHDAVASHRTAAWLHGLIDRPQTVEITVRRRQRQRPLAHVAGEAPRVRIHATTSLPTDDVATLGPIRLTSVARTALGLAALTPRELSAETLAHVVGKAVDLDLATDPWLWWLLSKRRCRGRNGVLALEAVLAERARLGPTESWLERRVLDVLSSAGLPAPVTQRVVRRRNHFVARADFCYEPERIILQALGYAHHRTVAQVEADTRRANELQLLGYDVYQFTFKQTTADQASIVRTVADALRSRGSHRLESRRAA